jgi:ATP-dependent Lon protease
VAAGRGVRKAQGAASASSTGQRPPAFTGSVKYAEANLYAHSGELVGDRNPREHEFSAQLRAFDPSKRGRSLGVAVLMALSSALINKSLPGGLVVGGAAIAWAGGTGPTH